jgi:hypothetical protein
VGVLLAVDIGVTISCIIGPEVFSFESIFCCCGAAPWLENDIVIYGIFT